MKRILLLSSLIAVSTGAFAQSATPAATTPAKAQQASVKREAPAPISKNAFAETVKAYNALVDDNKPVEAKEKWNDVNRVLMNSLRDSQLKINAANEAKNEAEKKAAVERMTKQRQLFASITQLRQTDLVANKVQINEKLNEFMATIQ